MFGKNKKQKENELLNFQASVTARDYLISTKFNGEIKDKKLLDELHGYKFDGYCFKEVKEQIVNLEFKNIEELMLVIDDLEYKQHILDTYRPITQPKEKISKNKNNKNKKEGV